MSQIDSAIAFAATAHAGQLRKYDKLPYVTHPVEVMTIVHGFGGDEFMKIAAVLHDVEEDCEVSNSTIKRRYGPIVADLVKGLTDVYTREEYPDHNRKQRKKRERDRLSLEHPMVQTIKYADMISNLRSIAAGDKDFRVVYMREMDELLQVMDKGDPVLLDRARRDLAREQNELLQEKLK